MHRKVAAALVAALALGIASCGESETLTRAQLVNRIEAACRQASERTDQEGRTARGENAFFTAVVAGQRQLAEDVEGLEPPDEVADEVDTLKEGLAQRADTVADVAATPRAEQERALAEAGARLESASRDVTAAFRSLGVRGCE